jgi:hypothetical protein
VRRRVEADRVPRRPRTAVRASGSGSKLVQRIPIHRLPRRRPRALPGSQVAVRSLCSVLLAARRAGLLNQRSKGQSFGRLTVIHSSPFRAIDLRVEVYSSQRVCTPCARSRATRLDAAEGGLNVVEAYAVDPFDAHIR